MRQILDSVRGRIFLILIAFVFISHVAGLWLYAERSDSSTTLLHDALLAERIALISRLIEDAPISDTPEILKLVSGPVVGFSRSTEFNIAEEPPEGSRPHLLEHLLSVFLKYPTHDKIQMRFSSAGGAAGTVELLATINGSVHSEIDHLPARPLSEIRSVGTAAIDIKLKDGTSLHAVAPLLGVAPFSLWKLGASLAAMLVTILPLGFLFLSRWTHPLIVIAGAADRLGRDIHTPPLDEVGPSEIRATAHAFNVMQERIRRLVQDRMAIAAAIAHDLGTPVTRLHLRAEEISDEETRRSILADLDQMRRMITETLSFARFDFSAEPAGPTEITSLVQRVCDELVDVGADVVALGPPQIVLQTKPTMLYRALSNLIENAVKYGKRARVTITSTHNSVDIQIDDDGPGIPERLLFDVFEPFRRLPHAGGDVEGTGLGLTAARSLVRSLGGEITLSNRPAGGLRATLHLPK